MEGATTLDPLIPVLNVTSRVLDIIFPSRAKNFCRVQAQRLLRDNKLKEYIDALTAVVKCQHHTRVVHVDLYPSNILWDYFGESIRIRIVDWDAATFMRDVFVLEGT